MMKMNISAKELDFKELNQKIRAADAPLQIDDCIGQRFICSGLNNKNITINGTPGNALGAYFDGGVITVNGNAQDAVGDTMNDGKIIIHGDAGDALGYAMRGGSIFVKGRSGYRTGIHMKQYKDKKPVIVIGGEVGSFLGEYLAGGIIIVLGLNAENSNSNSFSENISSRKVPVGNFTGTGMHGGSIYIRSKKKPENLPAQVVCKTASEDDIKEIEPYIKEFVEYFNMDGDLIMKEKFYILKPNAKNPYKQLYTVY